MKCSSPAGAQHMAALAALLCAIGAPLNAAPLSPNATNLAIVNRLSWGVSPSAAEELARKGIDRWVDEQLRMPVDVALPPEAQHVIDQMRIVKEPMPNLVVTENAIIRANNALTDVVQKQAAKEALQRELNDLAREAQSRSLLRDLYSPAQLREQMTWFWFNHFNIQASKSDIRAMIGDYEDRAIRPHALGRYRDLLEATLRHPAMLRYLDNDQNAKDRINENYAREIMELHSMGVGSGYTQTDVQELARILTGIGVNQAPTNPTLKPEMQPLYIRAGLWEFNPQRHDFGTKMFLGHAIKGQGFAEVEQALDLIARSPATAHHVSQQIAIFFMGDKPAPAVVDRMAITFKRSDGDIAEVLRTMIRSREFRASLGQSFKDPVHYVLSALRLSFDGRPIINMDTPLNWLSAMGETLYAHETPDGYPLGSAAWTSPGQMGVRFDVARQIGGGAPNLFKSRGDPAAAPPPAVLPVLQNALYAAYFEPQLAPQTRAALAQSGNPNGWNSLFLSSPEFMRR